MRIHWIEWWGSYKGRLLVLCFAACVLVTLSGTVIYYRQLRDDQREKLARISEATLKRMPLPKLKEDLDTTAAYLGVLPLRFDLLIVNDINGEVRIYRSTDQSWSNRVIAEPTMSIMFPSLKASIADRRTVTQEMRVRDAKEALLSVTIPWNPAGTSTNRAFMHLLIPDTGLQNKPLWAMIILAAVNFVAVFVVIDLGYRRLVLRRLETCTDATRQLARGESLLEGHLRESADEVGLLAKNLNILDDAIQRRMSYTQMLARAKGDTARARSLTHPLRTCLTRLKRVSEWHGGPVGATVTPEVVQDNLSVCYQELDEVISELSNVDSVEYCDPQRVCLKDLIGQAVFDSDSSKAIDWDPSLATNLICDVDPIQFCEVIENLLLNARQAAPPDALVKLNVSWTQTEFTIVVSNRMKEGSSSDVTRFGEPGYTTKSASDLGRRGYGLFRVKQVTRVHKGRFRASLDKGVVTVALTAPRFQRTEGMTRILLVDDDIHAMEALIELTASGPGSPEIQQFHGRTPLKNEDIWDFKPDLALVDFDLGVKERDGLHVVDELLPHIGYVVLLTQHVSKETRLRTPEGNQVDAFPKPLTKELLSKLIGNLQASNSLADR